MIEQQDLTPWIERIAEVAEGYEFRTFLLGTTLPPAVGDEEALRIRHVWNRTIGLALEALWPERLVEFKRPDIRFLIGAATDELVVKPSPLFVYGRYVKDARDIPQARWHCQVCFGRGCERCGGTGHRYPITVEECVGLPLREMSGAIDSRIHGAGREDVDARMLGRGRPFVMTLVEPRRRSPDLAAAAAMVPDVSDGRVSVIDLRIVPKAMVKEVTQARAEKVYLAGVECESDLPADTAERVAGLAPLMLNQRTPTRVMRRRSDLVRYRRILEIDIDVTGARSLDLRMRTESGTYVKEFVSGDEGRTQPSLAGILGVPCRVATLDVLEVAYDPPTS